MKKSILIASSTIASDEYVPVAQKLTEKGYEVTTYNSDLVFCEQDSFMVNITEDGQIRAKYNDKDISNKAISALWYRKVADFQKPERIHDKAKALLLQDEVEYFHQDIWMSLYDKGKWLNAPEDMICASNKLGQLAIAKEIGFNIPETIVSSDWNTVQSHLFVDKRYRDIIVKMVRGVIIINNQDMALPTTILSKTKVDTLKDITTPFPGIYQPYKQKLREWRVTVVGEDIFPIAIYTDKEAKDDWRRHQNSPHVRFRPEGLDDETTALCIKFLAKYNLKFGAFDLVEDKEGQKTFLECNANGQYYIFEEHFNIPISDAIVKELINISNKQPY